MIDQRVRPIKDRLVDPVARRVPAMVPVGVLTGAALVVGLAAALSAAAGLVIVSVGLWLCNRVLDGLDGAVARSRQSTSDLGGYVDIVGDVVVYAAVPLGVAVALGSRSGWIAVAALLAVLYVNAVSWAVLAALLEKRGAGVSTTAEATSIRMPTGLVEGAETIVGYSLLLLLPHRAVEIASILAGLVGVGIVQRIVAARRLLAG